MMPTSRLNNSFKLVLPNSEFLKAILVLTIWLHCICTLADLRSPGLCQALCYFHGSDPLDFWCQLRFLSSACPNQNMLQHKHFENSPKSKIPFRLQEFSGRRRKQKSCAAMLCFLQNEQLHKDMKIFSFLLTVYLSTDRWFRWNTLVIQYSLYNIQLPAELSLSSLPTLFVPLQKSYLVFHHGI